jgi:CTD kinase subunit gamma
MDEDLHSCILENLERGASMNNKANVMYYLERHVEVNMSDGGHAAYVEMVRRDIARIVDAVTSGSGGAGGGANLKVARKVVGVLGERGVLDENIRGEIESGLREVEERLGRELDQEHDGEGDGHDGTDRVMHDVTGPGQGGDDESKRTTPKTKDDRKPNGVSKVDKRAIEQRVEEDRERNKRLRESVWAVNGDDDQELDKMWEEGSDLNEDDYVIGEEEIEERLQFARYHRAMIDT